VADDGGGFDVAAIGADPRRGIGLRNMRERVESVGGVFKVHSRPGATRVIAQLPAEAVRRFTLQPLAPHAHPARR
jgi:two-component system NarL family sensor kinase